MCFKTAGAEKTGEWASRIWILRWIGEKVSAARIAGGKKSGESNPLIWTPGWIEEKVNAVRSSHGFLEVVRKLHLSSDSRVAGLFKMLTYFHVCCAFSSACAFLSNTI
jgi:hypothetical protein